MNAIRQRISTYKSFYDRYKRYLPAVAFLGGFLWDAITLGAVIAPSDLVILLAYFLGSAFCLVLIGKNARFRFSEHLPLLIQFFFGGLCSALVVFYFKSSGSYVSYIFVLALIGLLVGNEFLEDKYENLTLSLTFFCFTGTMYLHFALPHLFKSVHPVWFYISTGVAIAITYGVHRMCTAKQANLLPSYGVTAGILLLHWLQVIPPVPMVLKENIICRNFAKKGGQYTCSTEKPKWYQLFAGKSERIYRFRAGERVYCLTSVFAPTSLEATVLHNWYKYDERSGDWQKTDSIPFSIRGGRESGWRLYSNKSTASAGQWRVETRLKDGAPLGYYSFEMLPAPEGEELELRDVRLD